MRVVTYARVSTVGQEKEGQSLPNQERAFDQAIERNGWRRVRHYREAASAKTVAGRAEFTRMIAELPKTKPTCIIVDTMDRFTRNLREGLNLLEELRGHGVGLLPLDWHRSKPLDLDDDRDWDDVVDEFRGAERERRRISKRIKRSYEGREERGAVMANRAPHGLVRKGDHFVPGPGAAIIRRAEDKALKGVSLGEVLRYLQDRGVEWKSLAALKGCFTNESYVKAGARSVEQHQALRQLLDASRSRHGQERVFDHEFTGVFECGICGSVMYGRAFVRDGQAYQSIACDQMRSPKNRHWFSVSTSKIADKWLSYIEDFSASPSRLDRWARGARGDARDLERSLQTRLARIDQQAAALKNRRDAAFDLLSEKRAALAQQARKLLTEIERDEMALEVQRSTILGELANLPAASERDPNKLREQLRVFIGAYTKANARKRNKFNLLLVQTLGSRPRVYRDGNGHTATIRIEWPGVISVSAGRASATSSGKRAYR